MPPAPESEPLTDRIEAPHSAPSALARQSQQVVGQAQGFRERDHVRGVVSNPRTSVVLMTYLGLVRAPGPLHGRGGFLVWGAAYA